MSLNYTTVSIPLELSKNINIIKIENRKIYPTSADVIEHAIQLLQEHLKQKGGNS